MSGILDQLLKSLSPEQSGRAVPEEHRKTTDTGAASGALLSAVLRGLAQKSQTKEGASSLWDMLTKHAEQGHLPTNAPASGKGIEVRDLDPKITDEILSNIFGENADKVQGRLGKVITLDPETTKKLMGAILPSILGGVLGQAKSSPNASPQSLPEILGKAKEELNKRQPKSGSVFDVILDRDHDGDVDLSDLLGMWKESASNSTGSTPKDSSTPASTKPTASGPTEF